MGWQVFCNPATQQEMKNKKTRPARSNLTVLSENYTGQPLAPPMPIVLRWSRCQLLDYEPSASAQLRLPTSWLPNYPFRVQAA